MCDTCVCMCESVDSRDPQLYEAALRESVLLMEEAFAREARVLSPLLGPVSVSIECGRERDVRWWMVARSGYYGELLLGVCVIVRDA